MHHLNRIYHQHLRLELLRCTDNGFHVGLGHESQFVCRQLQALRTHGDLLQGFLPGDIQGLHGTSEVAHGLQQQSTLTSARIAAYQDGRTWH